MKKLLVLAVFLGITLGFLSFRVQQSQATYVEVDNCAETCTDYDTVKGSCKFSLPYVGCIIWNYNHVCTQWENQCEEEPTITPTIVPEDPTPTPTETEPEPQATPSAGFQLGGAPQGPECPNFGGWAPTITKVWRVDSDTVGFEWTKPRPEADEYILWFGLSEDNLPYNKTVFGQSTTVDLPDHPNVHVWGSVQETDSGCVGKSSVVVDP